MEDTIENHIALEYGAGLEYSREWFQRVYGCEKHMLKLIGQGDLKYPNGSRLPREEPRKTSDVHVQPLSLADARRLLRDQSHEKHYVSGEEPSAEVLSLVEQCLQISGPGETKALRLTWEGRETPGSVKIGDRIAASFVKGVAYSSDGKTLGYYVRAVIFGGQQGNSHCLVLFTTSAVVEKSILNKTLRDELRPPTELDN